jgi:hypothetical protein
MTLCKKGVFGVDELRRGIEALPPDAYKSLSYYEKWARSAAASLTDQGVLTLPEIEAALGHEEEADPPVKCALLCCCWCCCLLALQRILQLQPRAHGAC